MIAKRKFMLIQFMRALGCWLSIEFEYIKGEKLSNHHLMKLYANILVDEISSKLQSQV
jgi:hypothetical protein